MQKIDVLTFKKEISQSANKMKDTWKRVINISKWKAYNKMQTKTLKKLKPLKNMEIINKKLYYL